MPAPRLPLALLAPISLVVLVVALGALQYRWVGQVSEAERGQLRQSLDRRAREFAADFDRELGRAHQIFRMDAAFTSETPDRLARQLEEWHSASRFAGVIKTAYFAAPGSGGVMLWRFVPETRAFESVEWPASLAPARDRLINAPPHTVPAMPGLPAGQNIITLTMSPVMPDIPALLIAQAQPGRGHVILELDREFISASVLPTLAEVHFPETGTDRYRVSVVDAQQQPLLSRGLLTGQMLSAETADAAAGLFGLRVEMIRGTVTSVPRTPSVAAWTSSSAIPADSSGSTGPGPSSSATRTRVPETSAIVVSKPVAGEKENQFSMLIEERVTGGPSHMTVAGTAMRTPTGPGWTLLLQHAAGSLDAAVDRARRRNLYLSFGILGVLAASAGLVMINARRSEKLAAQQMDFVATVSHELRTPLAVIRSAAQNLSAGVIQEPAQAKRYGELIETEGRRLTDMVEQVLEYAGLSGDRRPPASRPVDAAALAQDVVSTASSLPEAEGITFDVRADDQVAGRHGRRGCHSPRTAQPDRQRAEVRRGRPLDRRDDFARRRP